MIDQLKISVVTVVYNAETYLESCIKSVKEQSYPNIEFIVIDGGSTDNTLKIIEQYRSAIDLFVSEPDQGLYDAINKGIKMATGVVVGLLNADDFFADKEVIAHVAKAFAADPELEGLYGDLNYIHPKTERVVRKWTSKPASYNDIQQGWMPAHPTLYLKRSLFTKLGNYALNMGTAADYDLILKYFHTYRIKTFYLNKLMVNMRLGGVSNKSLLAMLKAAHFDYKALKNNKIPFPIITLLKKKLSKLRQFG